MPPVVFEPTISAGERQQTYALERAATGTGTGRTYCFIKQSILAEHTVSLQSINQLVFVQKGQ
jgi:hypothetical protein